MIDEIKKMSKLKLLWRIDMNRRVGLLILIILWVAFSFLSAEKSLERIANETGVQGEEAYNAGNYVEAGQFFEQAITKLEEAVTTDGIPMDDSKVNRWMELAFNGYYNGKDFENALRIQDERINANPSEYKLISTKVTLLKKYLGRTEDAIVVLEAYNDTKRTFKVEKRIASYYLNLNDEVNALIWYKKAYELKKDSSVIKNIATLYVNEGDNAKAVQAYEDFLQTDPTDAVKTKTYKNMGALYEDLKNYSKSNLYFEKSLELKYDKNINLKLIIGYYDNDNMTKAMEKVEQRLSKKSSDADAIYYRALIKYDQDDKAGAKSDFQKLLNGKYKDAAKSFIESIESEE
jgi:tetratricopeptide (TPR) repeat protein